MQSWECCYIASHIEGGILSRNTYNYEVRLATKDGYQVILTSDKWKYQNNLNEKQMVALVAKLGLDGWQPCINIAPGVNNEGSFMRPCPRNE